MQLCAQIDGFKTDIFWFNNNSIDENVNNK